MTDDKPVTMAMLHKHYDMIGQAIYDAYENFCPNCVCEYCVSKNPIPPRDKEDTP